MNELLAHRLKVLGLRDVDRILTHTNRTVMVSLTARRVLRLHEGYASAPDRVLRAIVRFLDPRLPRAVRRGAEREFLGFPVEAYAPPPAPRRAGSVRAPAISCCCNGSRTCTNGSTSSISAGGSAPCRSASRDECARDWAS